VNPERVRKVLRACAFLFLMFPASLCFSQTYTQRGFLENRATFYPQEAANDRARAVGESLFRYEGFYTPSMTLQFAGAVDFRIDTHHQVERDWKLSWQDREIRRPLGEVRRLSATYHRGPVTFTAGKQFIRWGKTDIVTPTDRFAPRDYLTVVDNDFIAVTAARFVYEKGSNTIEGVWSPRFTPSRVPLADQRWAGAAATPPVPISPENVHINVAGGSQAGVRWNHTGAIEYGISAYQGFNHLPSFTVNLPVAIPFVVSEDPRLGAARAPNVEVFYPKMLMAGGDIAIPTRLFTVKGEAAYFGSNDKRRVDEYSLYVVQLERQTGEWLIVGGYAGEVVTGTGAGLVFMTNNFAVTSNFAPDRGLTKTLLGRAGYTIDTNRSFAIESALRQNGDGFWLKGEYSQAVGQHWRATLNLTLIRGDIMDFLGQYRRNSHALLILRYSF
jgi:hypothetical protein